MVNGLRLFHNAVKVFRQITTVTTMTVLNMYNLNNQIPVTVFRSHRTSGNDILCRKA